MKSKNLSLLFAGVLLLVLFASFISAVALNGISLVSSPQNISHDAGSFDIVFNLTNEGIAGVLYWDLSNFTSSQASLAFSFDDFNIAVGNTTNPTTETITATISFNAYQTGTITGNINVGNTATLTDESLAFSVPITASSSLSVSSATIASGATSTTFTVTNNGNVPLTGITLTASGDFDVTLSSSTISSLAAGATSSAITATIAADDLDDLNFGTSTVTINASATGVSATGTITTSANYCSFDNDGDLEISIESIDNKGISGTKFGDDEEWFPLSEIEVEIEVRNEGDEDVDNIEIEWGLYNSDTGEWVIDDTESDFNLKDGDDKTIIITFQIDDIDELTDGNFIFYAKATGEIDGGTYDGDDTCISDSQSIDIIIENDFVVLDNTEFPEPVSCDSDVQITADVWNIGEDDQDDVYVKIYNSELGINEKIKIGDIDAFDKEKLNAVIKIPENAKEKSYNLLFEVYNDNDDIYENDYDDEESKFELELKVEGGCVSISDSTITNNAIVSANLQSGGKAGEELIIKAVITNLGNDFATYSVNVAGYADWATSPVVEPKVILVAKSGSEEVLITLNVNKDVSGEKTFDIELMSGNSLIVKQPVSVMIEGSSRNFMTGGIIAKDNLYLWGIGILNIILVIIIIVVAVRVAKQ
ncbi:MAG: putative S-layer protein [Nanoarchaeota archaeon]|nr:putative S-layer protein [Nanoarchaeota archaeon]